jgi:hypothetical protein
MMVVMFRVWLCRNALLFGLVVIVLPSSSLFDRYISTCWINTAPRGAPEFQNRSKYTIVIQEGGVSPERHPLSI